MKFEELHIKSELIKALHELGFTEPTQIQEKAIPIITSGQDLIGISETGSGKTAAFGVPMLEKIKHGHGIQALVMGPTRELVVQISQELAKFGKYMDVSVATIFGGVSFNPQIDAMRHANIVVGTPGRLLDHLRRGNLNLSHAHFVVLDEADKMVDMGFIDDVKEILNCTSKHKQMCLFGATISEEITHLKEHYMHNPVLAKTHVQVHEDYLQQFYYNVEQHEKFSLLVHLLRKEPDKTGRVMVFCSTISTVMLVTRNLRRQGIKAEDIHGKLSQNRRLKVIYDFKHGNLQVLVASAVAARGLDIKEVTHIINYDLSQDPQEYIHRIGRTARAGESGKAITLLSPRDHDRFTSILRKYDVKIQVLPKEEFPRLHFDAKSRSFRFPRNNFGNRGFQRNSAHRPEHGYHSERFSRNSFQGNNRRE